MDKKVHYPSILRLDEGDLKDVGNWEVGKTYEVKLKVKMVNKAIGEGVMAPSNDEDRDKNIHGQFEVLGAEAEKKDRGNEYAEIAKVSPERGEGK